MIFGIGTDIIEIERIEKAIARKNFVNKYFTKHEIEIIGNYSNRIAGNFAAKEAVSKALGTGFSGFFPIDIEILRDEKGKPIVVLNKNAKNIADKNNITKVHLTISHCQKYAVAYAIAEI